MRVEKTEGHTTDREDLPAAPLRSPSVVTEGDWVVLTMRAASDERTMGDVPPQRDCALAAGGAGVALAAAARLSRSSVSATG